PRRRRGASRRPCRRRPSSRGSAPRHRNATCEADSSDRRSCAMRFESGQVAVITGAASGLGLALATELAVRGVDLVLANVETDALDAAVTSFDESGAVAIGVPTDVRVAEQVARLATTTLDRFG